MKKNTTVSLLGATLLAVMTLPALAQTTPPDDGQRKTPPVGDTPPPVIRPVDPAPPAERPVKPERPVVIVRPEKPERPDAPVRPELPENPNHGQPADVREKIQDFQAAREAFIARQRELAKTTREGLTEEQRQQLLDSIKANQQEFRARMLEIKQEFRNREVDEVVDAARKAAEDARNRRGDK